LQSKAERLRDYLLQRREAQADYDKGDFPAAAKAYEAAFRLDPFAIDAAFEGVNSYLVMEQIEPAVRLLHAIRSQGTTEANQKAMKMLAELKSVDPAAAGEVNAEVPAPPAIEVMFPTAHFGTPDWDAGKRVLAAAPVDPSGALKDLAAKIPPPQSPSDGTGQGGPGNMGDNTAAMSEIMKNFLHVEVVPSSETRDLTIKRTAAGTLNDNSAMLQIEGGDPQLRVLYQGQIQRLPVALSVQAGKYEIRTVQDGKVVDTQEVEIAPGTPQKITIKR